MPVAEAELRPLKKAQFHLKSAETILEEVAAALGQDSPKSAAGRSIVLAAMRRSLAEARKSAEAELMATGRGRRCAQNLSAAEDEIIRAGNNFFGKVSGGLASAIEWTFQKAGRPNGYILGQDAGGAFVAGLAYGEGRLYTKDAGDFKVYWQGPSVGYDFGADGSKVMTLVYNLQDPSDIFDRFGGVEGAAYLVGGVSVQLQKSGHVTLAPIRAGVGLRLGANVGYLKYTRSPTWNPF